MIARMWGDTDDAPLRLLCGARKDLPAKEAEQTLSYFLTQCFSCFRSVRLEILDELVKALGEAHKRRNDMTPQASIVGLHELGVVLAIGVVYPTQGVVCEDHEVIHQILDLRLHRFATGDCTNDQSFVEEAHHLCDNDLL
mgnify:FL=1